MTSKQTDAAAQQERLSLEAPETKNEREPVVRPNPPAGLPFTSS